MANFGSSLEYTHTAIKHDQLRIIEVESLEPHISVKLVAHSDYAPPEYFALSYAWGSEGHTEHILCNGKVFKVTPHLKEGLLSLWNTCGASNLWVDAICIDQTSETEKEAQVAKMHEIYQRANGVYIWLGVAQDGSNEAIAAINNVLIPKNDKPIGERLLMHKSGASHLFDVALFKPIAALSRRSWFRRLWIAQEYFFAKSTKFLCGRSAIDGGRFVRALMMLTINSFGSEEPSGFQNEVDLFVGYGSLTDLDEVKEKYGQSKNPILLDFVELNRYRFGKEPVDRIYAAFGMAKGADEIYRKKIPIDYSEDSRKNYWRLYSQFGKVALKHEPRLRLLSMVSSEERPEGLPSWCPNFNSTTVTDDIDSTNVYAAGWPWRKHGKLNEGGHSESPQCLGHPNFKGELETHVSILPESHTISIWGAALGRIKAIGHRCEWSIDIDTQSLSSVQKLSKEFLRWLLGNENFCASHLNDENRAYYINEEVTVGATSDERRISKPSLDEERSFFGASISDLKMALHPTQSNEPGMSLQPNSPDILRLAEERESTKMSDVISETVKEVNTVSQGTINTANTDGSSKPPVGRSTDCVFVISTLFEILELEKEDDWRCRDHTLLEKFEMAYSWMMSLYEQWHNRVLFVTENGYFGFASEDVSVGDVVCMFYGGASLFVLSQYTEHYSFICDAYVLDCVNGEMFEMLDSGVIAEELFHIS